MSWRDSFALRLEALSDVDLAAECLRQAAVAIRTRPPRNGDTHADLCADECRRRGHGDLWREALAAARRERAEGAEPETKRSESSLVCDRCRWIIGQDSRCGCWPLARPTPMKRRRRANGGGKPCA